MAVSLSFHRLATQEFRQARSWYARRSRSAADPQGWPLYDEKNRWVKLKKFPYILIYRMKREDEVVIIAVAQTLRA